MALGFPGLRSAIPCIPKRGKSWIALSPMHHEKTVAKYRESCVVHHTSKEPTAVGKHTEKIMDLFSLANFLIWFSISHIWHHIYHTNLYRRGSRLTQENHLQMQMFCVCVCCFFLIKKHCIKKKRKERERDH